MAHLVDEGVPQAVGRVQDLGRQLDPARPPLGLTGKKKKNEKKEMWESEVRRANFFSVSGGLGPRPEPSRASSSEPNLSLPGPGLVAETRRPQHSTNKKNDLIQQLP